MYHRKSLTLPQPPSAQPTPAGPARAEAAHPAGRRFLVAWLPCFRLERCGWNPEDTVVLLAEERSAMRVQAMSLAVAREGVCTGMSISEVRAILPEVKVELVDEPLEERADLDALARLFERYSPNLRALPPQALSVELTGTRVAEVDVVGHARALLEDLGHCCTLVVSDDVAGGLALAAHGSSDQVVPSKGLAEALAELPVQALSPSPDMLDSLELLGLRRVGDLARMDAASIAGRFGHEGLEMHRIARGRIRHEPPAPPPPPQELVVRRVLPDAVEKLDSLVFALNGLCRRLCATLVANEEAATRLQLRLVLEGAPERLLPVRLGQPRRAPRELVRLLHQRLERVELEGPVTEVGLEVLERCPFLGHQQGLLDRSAAREPLDDLVGRLMDVLGEEALFKPRLEPEHRPEYAWSAARVVKRKKKKQPAVTPPGPYRPPLLLRDLQALRVRLTPAQRPREVQLEGDWSSVARLTGPERLVGAWWSSAPFDRDYFHVVLEDGRGLWLFHDRQGGDWWLQGVWD